jgi:putative ABC transport system permease protein
MLRSALRDLQFRRRRFAIAVIGASLVFGLSLVMSGLSASFANEARRTVDLVGADQWVVRSDVPGPFNAIAPLPADAVDRIAALPDVDAAAPFALLRQTIETDGAARIVNLMGVTPGQLGAPADLTSGGQVVVDHQIAADIGSSIQVGGRAFEVVGTVDATLFAGSPNVFVSLADAQAIGFGGQPLVSAVLVDGDVGVLPATLRVLDADQARADARVALRDAESTIGLVRSLLWIVAALVIGSVMYLNALERTRDFAVFKATGASTAFVAGGLAVQALVIGLVTSVLAMVIGTVIAPMFPMRVEIPAITYALTPLVVLAVALLASSFGVRRVAGTSPALAFGGP